ncbi:hypothetical protein [Isoptericola nanjingensis]|uniref:hypothetical protein n=1 Tax=Isoptericola nanjingensis TaxID=903413 RepID=UPI003D1A59D3
MTWTRLSDTFNDRPDLLGVGRSARLLHVEALVWSNRLLTDGAVPSGALPRLTDSPDPKVDVAELVAAGVWEVTEAGYQLDWSDQETAAEVESRREQNRARDERRRLHNKGDHSKCDPNRCWVLTREPRDESRVAHALPIPSRPVPTRPQGRDGDGDEDDGADVPSAGAPGSSRRRPKEPKPVERHKDGSVTFHMADDGEDG